MKRQRKKYSRPQKPFDKARIEEENVLKERYGLKNKREIWKADAAIGRIRNLAKQLIVKSDEEKQAFVERLQKKGFQVEKLADALALDKEDWLKRRLQTVVHAKKLANTPKQSRQLITHKHVSVVDRVVNIPSYQVNLEEETDIKLNLTLKTAKPAKKTKLEEIKKEVLEGEEPSKTEEETSNATEETDEQKSEPEADIKEEPKEEKADTKPKDEAREEK